MSRQMKDSGIEWIGEIPENWEITKHKYVMHKEKDICEYYNGEDIISLTMGGVIVRDLDAGGKMPTTFDGYQYVEPDKLLLCLFDIDVTPRCVGVIRNYGLTSPAYSKFVVHSGYSVEYYNHLLRAIDDDKVLVHLAKNLRSSFTETDFGALPTVVPPLLEQQAISAYLDCQCGLIDNVIEKTKASIEEYKKLRQAVITQAVTKGVRGERPMKDSGIEWIGEIPQEWDIVKFKYIATVKSNLVHPNDYPNYMQIAPDNIEKGNAKLLECKTVEEIGVESDNHLFYKGQIIYSKIRPILNKVIIAPFDGLCSADMYPIETSINKFFLVYMMLSERFLAQVKLVTENRVKMPKINQEELGQILIYLPQENEQQEIAEYLDKKCTEIDSLISKKEQFLTELDTYKKSLIYESVTGKKEVPQNEC